MTQQQNSLVAANGNRAPQQQQQHPVIATVTQLLGAQKKSIQSALPKHMTPERMCRIAVQTIARTPQLLECSPQSLVAAIIEASGLGLELDVRGQAYLVPFWNKKTGRKEVQFIPGYKGLMDLAYRSGRVSSIYAETVCENDHFEYSLGLSPDIKHRPALSNRGPAYAVYAVAKLKDADPVFAVLTREEIDKLKNASKAAASGPWKDWEEEMWKKSAIRRLCKYLPLSPEMQRAIALDEAGDAGKAQPLGENFIDLPEPTYTPNSAEALNSALNEPVDQPPTIDAEAAPNDEAM